MLFFLVSLSPIPICDTKGNVTIFCQLSWVKVLSFQAIHSITSLSVIGNEENILILTNGDHHIINDTTSTTSKGISGGGGSSSGSSSSSSSGSHTKTAMLHSIEMQQVV